MPVALRAFSQVSIRGVGRGVRPGGRAYSFLCGGPQSLEIILLVALEASAARMSSISRGGGPPALNMEMAETTVWILFSSSTRVTASTSA